MNSELKKRRPLRRRLGFRGCMITFALVSVGMCLLSSYGMAAFIGNLVN